MAIKGARITFKAFLRKMTTAKLHMQTPGSHITTSALDKLIGNVMPPNPDCKDCREHELARMHYTGQFRDYGLSRGFYFGLNNGILRTYTTNYNAGFVVKYAVKGRNAATRGKTLNDSSKLIDMHHQLANAQHFKVAIDALDKVA